MTALRSRSASREALVLAVCLPVLCIHERYNPNLVNGSGSAGITVALSDLAALLIVGAAVNAARREGLEPLRRGGVTLAAAIALLAAVVVWTLLGPSLATGYPFAHSAVSAAKFVEYGLLALAVPLIVRRKSDAAAVGLALIGVAAAASVGGLLQLIGLLGNLDNVPAGRRMPSFLGYHDFAALSGVALGIAIAVIASGTWARYRKPASVAAAGGVLGVAIAGALATVLALLLGGVVALVYTFVRRTSSLRRVLAIAGLLAAISLGSLLLRGGDVADYIGFLGKKTQASDQRIETYSQRTVLAYIGLAIFRAHPLTGVGWQGSALPASFEPHLASARQRFPEVADQAFPSAEHRFGVQNAYVQAAADMGLVGLAILLISVGSAFIRALTRSMRGAAPPAPMALALTIAILVGAFEWAALGLVPGVPMTALMWLAIGGAIALPRVGDLPDELHEDTPTP